MLSKNLPAQTGRDPEGHVSARVARGVTFASAQDASSYRVLAVRRQRVARDLAALDEHMAALLYRSEWSLTAIQEREG